VITVDRQGAVVVAVLDGEIDLSNATSLAQQLTQAVPDDAAGLVVDLGPVTYLDSTGVRLLFDLALTVGRMGKRVAAVVPRSAPVRPILDIAGLATRVPVCEGVSEAERALASDEAGSHLTGTGGQG
jgi:anti-anti-sigma factor